MLLNRRQFLYITSATTLVAVCSNALLGQSLLNHPPQESSATLKTMQALPQQKNRLLGYPINMTTPPEEFFAWRKELFAVGLNQFAFNNVGNPFDQSHIAYNSHAFEKELINRFGVIYGFSPQNIWGFLTNSGTDSNMHGLYMGARFLKPHRRDAENLFHTRGSLFNPNPQGFIESRMDHSRNQA